MGLDKRADGDGPSPGGAGPRTLRAATVGLAAIAVAIVLLLAGRSRSIEVSAARVDPPITGSVLTPEPTTSGPTTTVAAGPTTSGPPPRSRLVVSAAGDTNLDPGYIPAFTTEGYDLAFSGLQDAFRDDDLTVVNLECASSRDGVRQSKQFNFNCDPAALPVLERWGVDVANLANNHAGDYGADALLETRANVAAAGVTPVGVGADVVAANEAALFEINGWTVAVVGFGGVVPWADWLAGPDHPGMSSGDDIDSMVAAVEAADARADLVFVTIHWGVELDVEPRPEDVERAHALIDAGADAIFGHHPHRLQPLELYRGRPIAWSLGNFVWPRLSAAGATSAIAQVVVEPDGSIGACLIPVDIESDGHPVVQVELEGPCTWNASSPTSPPSPVSPAVSPGPRRHQGFAGGEPG